MATPGTAASATMVITELARNFPVSAPDGLTHYILMMPRGVMVLAVIASDIDR